MLLDNQFLAVSFASYKFLIELPSCEPAGNRSEHWLAQSNRTWGFRHPFPSPISRDEVPLAIAKRKCPGQRRKSEFDPQETCHEPSFDHLVGADGQRERTLRRIGTSALRCRRATVFDQPSFEQSRGTMFILASYLAESSLTIGSVTVSSAVYQPEIT